MISDKAQKLRGAVFQKGDICDRLGPLIAWVSLGAIAAVISLQPTTAFADVLDRPYFKASSLVIVFGADDFAENGGVAPVVFDFVTLENLSSGAEGNDLIAADGRSINYNTQRYNPIQSGDNSGWEFQVNGGRRKPLGATRTRSRCGRQRRCSGAKRYAFHAQRYGWYAREGI